MRLAADEGADWPAVGDWVVVELHGAETSAVIQEVLPRRSRFVRKSPGKRIEEQVIAANVDTAPRGAVSRAVLRVRRAASDCFEQGGHVRRRARPGRRNGEDCAGRGGVRCERKDGAGN